MRTRFHLIVLSYIYVSFFYHAAAAHHAAIYCASKGLSPRHRPSAIEQRCNVACTLTFSHSSSTDRNTQSPRVRPLYVPNPIGLAAGFDKDGVIVQPLFDLGFGAVEVGTVTPKPQPGNPKPRMFRIPEQLAIINRYGFNSPGADVVETNLRAYYDHRKQQWQHYKQRQQQSTTVTGLISNWLVPPQPPVQGAVGINIGKNRDSGSSEKVLQDYALLIRQLGPLADYLVLNVSSPNTAGLRDWQSGDALRSLLVACLKERNQLVLSSSNSSSSSSTNNDVPPLFVKLAPDLTDDQLREIAQTCLDVGIDGLVVSNTTNQRPADLIQHHVTASETGGLSGAPVKDMSTHCIRVLYAAVRGQLPIVGVGGVSNGEDAYEKLRAGASWVQIYSTLVYQGPGVVSRIRQELAERVLTLHGQATGIQDVVGLDHDALVWERRQAKVQDLEQRALQLMEKEQAMSLATTTSETSDDDDATAATASAAA